MAFRRNSAVGNHVVTLGSLGINDNVNLLEEFFAFCKSKNIIFPMAPTQGGSGSGNLEGRAAFDTRLFRADLVMFFGNQLQENVIDDLCKFVEENSLGKCMSCMLPIESLVLSVLHILHDAGQLGNCSKENVASTGVTNAKDIRPVIVVNDFAKRTDEAILVPSISTRAQNTVGTGEQMVCHSNGGHKCSFQAPGGDVLKENINPNVLANHKDKCSSSFTKDSQPNVCSGRSYQRILQPSISPRFQIHEFTRAQNIQKSTISSEVSGFAQGNKFDNPILVPDNPLRMQQGNQMFVESSAATANPHIMSKKVRIEDPKDLMLIGVNAHRVDRAKYDVLPKCMEGVGTSFRGRCQQLGRLSDGLYNERHFGKRLVSSVIDLTDDSKDGAEVSGCVSIPLQGSSGTQRFPISDVERGLYNVICRLAHSKLSCNKAVEFSLTNVTYSSLGESVEDGGKVDNFFVAVMCRNFFEDVHPRQSKKHFFYPKVGGCLYTYNCAYDVKTVQRSFLGANSAYKLHLSHMLFFPVILHKHWFVFVVDIKNKQFVILDSQFDGSHEFHIDATRKLVNAFKECWYEHAEVKIDVDCFSVVYPAVPKQLNAVDCGIFAVKFMELWENNVDLKSLFDHSDIPNIMIKLAVQLYFNKANCVDKSVVVDSYEQGVDPLSWT